MTSQIAIIVLNYNGISDTLRCLESLESQAALVVVVDNASHDDPGEIARRYPAVVLLRRETNGGWAGGNNTGIRYALEAGCSLIVLLNNDTTTAPEFVDRMIRAADAHRDYGVLGPLIHAMERPAELMTAGCRFNRSGTGTFFSDRPDRSTTRDVPAIEETDIVNGCCLMARREVFEAAGLIDERFFLVHEESDFCLRAARAGFRSGIIGVPLVWHKGSSSFQRVGNGLQRYYDARNMYLLLKKHAVAYRRQRGPLRSWLEYLKYVYFRYAIEREHGHDRAADAVIEGVYDALAGRFGVAQPEARRPALPALRCLFALWWRRPRRAAVGRVGVN